MADFHDLFLCESCRDIIGHIVYDFQDKEMMERFRPSLGTEIF